MKKNMLKNLIAGTVLIAIALTFAGCPSGRGYRRSYSPSVRRSFRPGRPGYRVGLPRHVTPRNIQRKFRRDVEHLRRSRRQGRRGY